MKRMSRTFRLLRVLVSACTLMNYSVIVYICCVCFCCVPFVTAVPTTVAADTGLTQIPYCQNGFCGHIRYYDIQNMFNGLLLTLDEIENIENHMNYRSLSNLADDTENSSGSSSDPTLFDDGSTCCSSRVQHIANTTLTNIEGDVKAVIHLADADPPSFQYIPHASCVEKGKCEGTCVIEAKIITLLVHDASAAGYVFGVFEIPGYCTCKNIQ